MAVSGGLVLVTGSWQKYRNLEPMVQSQYIVLRQSSLSIECVVNNDYVQYHSLLRSMCGRAFQNRYR